MSTITVVRKNGEAAIAADSLTKWGASKESAEYVVNHDKLIGVGESWLAVSGPTTAKMALKHYFARHDHVNLATVDEIFSAWIALHAALKEEYFLNPNEDPQDSFESSRMDVLVANPHGIFGITGHRTVQEFSRFYAFGGGWQYAIGAMRVAYGEPSRSAEDIARLGVEVAAEFHDETGGPVTSVCIVLTR